jgi:hypothetical protein
MTDTTLQFPPYVSPTGRLYLSWHVAALLAAALISALVEVEDCTILPGLFSNGSSSGFDASRKVCGRSVLAAFLARKVKDTPQTAIPRISGRSH